MRLFRSDLFQNFVFLLKICFSAFLPKNFSTIYIYLLAEFRDKFFQKVGIFPNKANFKSALLIFCLGFSCLACQKKKATTFQGVAMQMPYRVEIGRDLSREEKHYVHQILSSCFAEVNQISNHWNPVSELSLINKSKSTEPTAISPYLNRLLKIACEIVDLSKNRYDPTLRPLIQIWKSSMARQKTPPAKALIGLKKRIGWEHLLIKEGTIQKDSPDIELDLDAIAKGMVVDVISEKLLFAGFTSFLVEWSGEIRCHGAHPEDRPWRIEIYSPLGRPSNIISLNNQAIATSGSYTQYWAIPHQGKTRFFTHLVNKQTFQPLQLSENSTLSVTVRAPSCVLADGLATAAMLFENQQELQEWIKEVKEIYPEVTFWVIGRHEW